MEANRPASEEPGLEGTGRSAPVDVRLTPDGLVRMRHKSVHNSATLSFTPEEWDLFVRRVKEGDYDLQSGDDQSSADDANQSLLQ